MTNQSDMTAAGNAEQLRQFATQLSNYSQSVGDIATQINTALLNIPWKDGYKDKLQQDWDGHFHSTLNTLQQNLSDVAGAINVRAGDYERLGTGAGGGATAV